MTNSNRQLPKAALIIVSALYGWSEASASDQTTPVPAPIRIEVQSTPLMTTTQGTIATVGDSSRVALGFIDPGIVTISSYEVLPNGEIVVSCRQSARNVSMQGVVLGRRGGKDILQ